MSNQAKKIALEAEALSKSAINQDGSKLIVMKGPLSEVFTKALNVVFAKPNVVTGEYVAMESQAIDTVLLKRAEQAVHRRDENNVVRVGHNGAQVENASQTDDDYTIYGVNKLGTTPEDIIAVKGEMSKLNPDERSRFALVVNYCVPSHYSPNASAQAESYMLNLETALENMVESMGGKTFRSLDQAMSDVTRKKTVAVEGLTDSIKRVFSGGGSTISKGDIVNGKAAAKVESTFLNNDWMNKRPFKNKKVVIRKRYPTFVSDAADFGLSLYKSALDNFEKNMDSTATRLANDLRPFEQAISSGEIAKNPETYYYRLEDAEIVSTIPGMVYPKEVAKAFPSLDRNRAKNAAAILLKVIQEKPASVSPAAVKIHKIGNDWYGRGGFINRLNKLADEGDGSMEEEFDHLFSDLEQILSEIEANLDENYVEKFREMERINFIIDLANYINESAK